jgi:hypothetical protein
MPMTVNHSPSVAEAVNQLVRSSGLGAVISIADAVEALRRERANLEHTDDELAELVATVAIAAGRNVAFDRSLRELGHRFSA